jgi:cyclopropane fatty-acyl-phospholipid synthase-like methyltransferase
MSENRPKFNPGLRVDNFEKICVNGFGEGLNAYPHAMVWFKNKLYVATTRANLHLLWFTIGDRVRNFQFWPVEHPQNPYDLDLRAQIWRYDPASGQWENVYIAPMIMGSGGFKVPLAIGFRGAAVHQAPNDPEPAIYIPTWSPRLGPGPVLLRSYDGKHFAQVSEPGLGDPTVTTIRSVVSFKGRLFISPTGTTKNHFSANIPDRLVILAGTNLEKNDWQLACEPFFGDKTNEGVFCMAVFNDHLYAGTANGEEGFQLWKTDGAGSLPYRWTRVLTQGCYRGKENQGAVSMTEFKGKLYIGGGILGGYDRPRNIGPAAPELVRVSPDDSWELVVGEARLTPEGLKAPISGLGPGFNNPAAGYFWRMSEHEGHLYLGTYDMTNWMSSFHSENMPRKIQNFVNAFGLDAMVESNAGFDLWRSPDGDGWTAVSNNGFGNRFNFGIRTMASSPYGLFIGASNPYGPKVAVKRLSGWRYEENPNGGLEIWLGRQETSKGAEVAERFVPRPITTITDRRVLPGREINPDQIDHLCEVLIKGFYGGSDFRHCGLWAAGTTTPKSACENLMTEVLAFADQAASHILEIGCGRGETTKAIARHFPLSSVTAIAWTEEDKKSCLAAAPAVTCIQAAKNHLRVDSAFFDLVISIEGLAGAASLLPEIQRVLKPNGLFLFTDILFTPKAATGKSMVNIADTLDEYKGKLRTAGFASSQFFDTTALSSKRMHDALHIDLRTKMLAQNLSTELFDNVLVRLPWASRSISHYIVGNARKGQPS